MADLSTDNSNNNFLDQEIIKRNISKVPITLNIRYKTQTFSVECDLYDTLKDLKGQIDKLTDVDPQVQKLVNKSITSVKRDDTTTTLKDLNITDGQTLLLVGATRSEILSTTRVNINSTGNKDSPDEQASTINKKEPLCKQTKHEKVLKAGE
jgi:predicted DNA-binding ArsR family transcriptional regulator